MNRVFTISGPELKALPPVLAIHTKFPLRIKAMFAGHRTEVEHGVVIKHEVDLAVLSVESIDEADMDRERRLVELEDEVRRLRAALDDAGAPMPRTKGLGPADRAAKLAAELERRAVAARRARNLVGT